MFVVAEHFLGGHSRREWGRDKGVNEVRGGGAAGSRQSDSGARGLNHSSADQVPSQLYRLLAMCP